MSAVKVYLLDIEGTVAPIAFVYEQLFPYARAHFEQFLWDSEKEAEAQAARGEDVLAEGSLWRDLMALGAENRMETDAEAPRIWPGPTPGGPTPGSPRSSPGRSPSPSPAPSPARADAEAGQTTGVPRTISMAPAEAIPKFLAYIDWLMDRDRKSTALKSLQGKVWKAGFEAGALKGELFDDVPAALRRWAAEGRVAIYSSGSAEAQRLIFRYSNFGDLSGLIAGYFDTTTGPKRDAASYAAIAESLGVAPEEVLFLSDVVAELDAARKTGCKTRLVVRTGNAAAHDAHGHGVLETFAVL